MPVLLPAGASLEASAESFLAAIPAGHRVVAVQVEAGAEASLVGTPQTSALDGHRLASFQVQRSAASPVQLTVVTEPDPDAGVRRLRSDSRRDARTREQLRRVVVNPAAVHLYAPKPAQVLRKAQGPERGFAPSAEPSLDGSPVTHLIVTTEALAPAFEPLAAWRTSRGFPSQIRTVEWIEARTRHGVDRAETIRNFLVDAYALWGVEWVLLGGDTDVIPVRFARSAVFAGTQDEYAPSDLYYACLDGTWNGDGDGYWGEGASGSILSEADMLPELFVGRAPVRTSAEVTTFLSKVMNYETPVHTDYQHQVALFHEVLVPANWDSSESIVLDAAPVAQQMIQQFMPPNVVPLRNYDTYWLYPGSTKLSKAATLAQLNAPPGVVNHLGHGYRYTMSVGDISIVNADVNQLNSGDRTFLLFLANCAAVAFDYDCLAEQYMRNPNGGAAAVIGAARSVSAIYVTTYNLELMRQLYAYGEERVAAILNGARLARAGYVDADNHDRQVQFALNALGDPATPVFTGPVRTADVVFADTLVAGDTTLVVNVSVDAQPLAGAVLCAMKAGEVYAAAETDSSGNAGLAISPRTGGTLALAVTGPNIVSASYTVQVLPAAPALVRIASVSLDDDALPPSSGNGNGASDAGEVIELDVVLRNTGGSTAAPVAVQLSSPDSSVVVLQGSFQVAALAAADSLAVTDSLHVQIAPWVPDGTRIALPVQIIASGDTLQDRVLFTVCAPRLEVTRVQLIGGATTQLQLELKNYGAGTSTNLQATLLATPPIAALADSASAAALAPWTSVTLAPLFEIDTSGGIGNGVTVSATDAQGRSIEQSVDLVPPGPATGLVTDAAFAAGTVRVLWNAPPDSDVLGYHVFRAPFAGAFTQLSPDVLVHRDYRDTSVQPGSSYAYYVVAVDSSRQWSAPSDTVLVSTTVPLLAGWPLPLGGPTGSSVAVGDLDGDGAPEIVVASDSVVYAWHGNGQEVIDGDGSIATFGILSNDVDLANASVALGELDATAGLEMVVAAWGSNAVYALDGNGALLPGWPQHPASPPGTNPGYWGSPAVGDVDGDGFPEIVAMSKDGSLYAWNANGSPLIPGTNGTVLTSMGTWTQNTPALADLDGNGAREIIIGTSVGMLYAITGTGAALPGWPVNLSGAMKGSAAVGDVDDDGTLDIVVTNWTNQLYVLRANGTHMPGFPVAASSRPPDMGPSPALGDLNGDGKLEIVIVTVPQTVLSNTQLRVFNWQGQLLLSKPLGGQSQSSPILADLDGDGGTDIVVGGETGLLNAWDANGNDLAGFPIPIGDVIRSTPTYADVDQDGFGDLVLAGWDGQLSIWSMLGEYAPERAPWPTFHADAQRRGVHRGPSSPTSIGQDDVTVPARLVVHLAPNPFNPRLTLRIAVPAAATHTAASPRGTHVRVDLYDARGQLVRRLVDRPLPAGWHTETWDGRDDDGRTLSSGVYFYSVRASGTATTGKVTLLR